MDEFVKWWIETKDEDDHKKRAAHLLDETKKIEDRQSAWYELNLWNATLLTNRELIGFHWGSENHEELVPADLRSENMIEQICEAMCSKASSSPLKPSLQPHGNSYKTERAVRTLDNFLFGVWRQTKAEDAAVQMFRDAFTSGLGCVRVAYDGKTKALHVEPVFFDNIVIDNRECADRAPPRTYRIRRVVSRAAVEAQFGITLDKQPRYVDYREVGDGYVVLIEAWRLPDCNGKGGRHVVACCDKLITDEEWTHDWVPLVFFHWGDRMSGFLLKSAIEKILPYQIRQNELNDDIKAAQDLSSRMRLLLRAGSEIDTSQWDTEQGRFLMFTGEPPIDFKWSSNLTELYGERDRNFARAFSAAGVSEGTVDQIPTHIRGDSSAFWREARNMEDQRHLRLWVLFEEARMEIAKAILRVLRTASGAEAFTTQYKPARMKAKTRTIEWKAVKHLLDNQFSWTMEPTPLTQLSPAARREVLRDFTSRQLIKVGSEEARRMEGNPNLDRIEDMEMAAEEAILYIIENLEEGIYMAPTTLTPLSKGVEMVTANYHRLLKYDDVETSDDFMQLHLKWIASAKAKEIEMIRKQEQQAMQAEAPQVPFAPTQGMPGTSAAQAPAPRTVINYN